MATYPWKNSDDIISAIKRKISFPISQNTMSEDDLLAFANEEMLIGQVPSVLEYHEEYYSTTLEVPLEANKSNYEVPDRAIGGKLRDIFYKDQSGNLVEMTRVDSDDRAFFQAHIGASNAVFKFYMQGNDVVLTPAITSSPIGSLVFVYFIRPNQLVATTRAATISSFIFSVSITNASVVAGDTLTVGSQVFTAVAGSPSANEFQIGATATITASNLSSAINTNGTYTSTATVGTVSIAYSTRDLEASSSNTVGLTLSSNFIIQFSSIPSNITNGSYVDFLQTKPGHKIRSYGIQLSNSAISSSNISFDPSDVPSDLVVGDYICLENECIIPFLPTDLHVNLVERSCARILAAIGDQQGAADITQKIKENDMRQGSLIDNRVEGAPKKVNARHSLLRFGKMGPRRNLS